MPLEVRVPHKSHKKSLQNQSEFDKESMRDEGKRKNEYIFDCKT